MFDLGWTELMVIGIVALIVVGPKDLPVMFRQAGKFMGKIKAMGREFSRAMNQAADDAGVGDVKKSLDAAANPQKFGLDKLQAAANIKPGGETDKLAKKREAERAEREARSAEIKAEKAAQAEAWSARSDREQAEADRAEAQRMRDEAAALRAEAEAMKAERAGE